MEDRMISQIMLVVKKCFIINKIIPAINKYKGESL